MSKIKVSEIFGPAGFWTYQLNNEGEHDKVFTERWGVTQGEGKFVGQRSVFIRTFGCGLRCPGFGLPVGQKTTEPHEIAKNIGMYKSINDLPAARYGCDSYYSVYPEFKGLSPAIDTSELVEQLLAAAGGSFFKGSNPTHLIFTGGEPMLGWQRAYPELIQGLRNADPVWKTAPWKKLDVTFETNGTEKIMNDANGVSYLSKFTDYVNLTWSVSPKLSISGHTEEEAIHPTIVRSYLNYSSDMYFKFVVQSVDDFNEVDEVIAKYKTQNINVPVYIMPEGGTVDEFNKHATLDLISEAVKRGYNVTPRLHVIWGGNNIGW